MEREKEVIELRRSGVVGRDIAKKLQMRTGDVHKILREAGVGRRRNMKPLDASEKKQICDLYLSDEGLSVIAIRKLMKRSQKTVSDILREAGITQRTSSVQQKLDIKHGRRIPKRTHWKGGRGKFHGYIRVWKPEHPKANGGYVFEHILVWEETHGQPLPDGWVVHHLNGIKSDNRPKNLLGMARRGHSPSLTVKEVQARLREVEAQLSQQRLC
ncbi:MAG: HNH endonuclease signature motif containing protein [Chloroflexi bacterium]|nr:HNH endonuclease signature motif containing protein [Chloroflexota bacterium]